MRLFVFGICAAVALSTAVASAANAGCSAPQYRQYDFFVGNWIVTRKDGKQFATDQVSKAYGGCVVWEQWHGSSSHGAGYSGYDAVRKVWVQSFMDDQGSVYTMEGHRTADALTFEGPDYPKAGVVEQNRVAFRPLAGGVVEEYWTVSTDGWKTSKVVFDGFFHPVKQAATHR
ncbi:MAG TPA: hypothetical protein VGN11_10150 [Candidatus Baltobacteraceae bacterium]|nr:hypothetical protein [Candidatus Baltobacteraceae bacterium]